MDWPQITVLVIFGARLGMDAVKHGQPRTGKHHFGDAILAVSIWGFLLWSGGFFG